MRCKTPQDIFFPAHLSQVEAIRRDVTHLSQFAFVNQFVQSNNCRVIFKHVAHHEDAAIRARDGQEFFGFLGIKAKRFLDTNVLAGFKASARPNAANASAQGATADSEAERAAQPSVFNPGYGVDAPPTAAKGNKRPFLLDPLLNSN